MRKALLILFLLMTYPTRAQIGSGTVLVFNLSKDQIVVAADSRIRFNRNAAAPNDSYCKIAAFSHQFVFTSVGNNSFTSGFPALVRSWDNIELARDAIRSTSNEEAGEAHINAMATRWANTVGALWNSLNQFDGLLVRDVADLNRGQLTAGVFIQAKGLLMRGVAVSLNTTNFLTPIHYDIGSAPVDCWPCGQKQGEQICAGGKHLDVAIQFCAERKKNTKVEVRTPLVKAKANTRLAVKIAELTIDAYGKTAGDVGGDIDTITLRNDGTIIWNSRKTNCPEDQD